MTTQHLSRRALLRSAGAGLIASFTWPAWVQARAQTLPNFSFLVVSDTHLGRGDQPGPARQWEQTARALDAAAGDFILHLGDIVDDGREPQYAVYRDIRKVIRKPIHEIPGNHDPQELFEKHLRRPVELAFDHQGIRFLLCNNSRRDSHDGFLTAAQLAWLDKECAEAARRDLFVILCSHVPVHENRHPDRGWYVKPKDGQEALYALVEKHRQRVLAFLHGHFHNGVRGWNDHGPLQEVVFPSALYNQDRRLAEQKAPGFYLPELRPGFVRVTLDRAGMTLRYQPLGADRTTDRVCPLPQWQS
jgi:3',5'-cyclic AMP phosphodiesterase CpdA